VKINKRDRFRQQLEYYLFHIAKDNKNAAKKFNRELREKIESIPNFPYKHRQSINFDDKNYRDLVYKGYVIPYFIDEARGEILILGIYKENIWHN